MKVPTEDTLDRLAKALMVNHSLNYSEAVRMLSKFKLNLVCDDSLGHSAALQAALLTAVNTGKRAFHGGVSVSMPPNIPCLVSWPGKQNLNQVVQSLGGSFEQLSYGDFTQTLYLCRPEVERIEGSFLLLCSGWRGGIVPYGNSVNVTSNIDFALGGIVAAALGVAHGFLRVSGISTHQIESPQGVSLWRPDLDWTSHEADGPGLEILPNNLWMLGLGHLGQGYLWSFSLLPYANPADAHFLLHDFDKAVKGNFSSGLLCEPHNEGKRKTRLCSDWLGERGFQTTIVERRFDTNTKREGEEPFVACCGFDSGDSRRILESAGFDLVIECALGSDTPRFDRIILHTFPNASKTPSEIWAKASPLPVDKKLVDAFKTSGDCGILAETLAQKAISTSFSGAFAGALVAGELLRALHGGIRCEYIHAHLRHGESPKVIVKSENYLNRVARSGYISARVVEQLAA